jgi:hypothetical protein
MYQEGEGLGNHASGLSCILPDLDIVQLGSFNKKTSLSESPP